MGLNSIFALFGFSDEEGKSNKLEKDFLAYKETPHFKLGMFNKLIMNGTTFKTQIF